MSSTTSGANADRRLYTPIVWGRNDLLGSLAEFTGRSNWSDTSVLITSVYFGIAHYYGVPYGIVGVVMSFIPGWLMGKSMQKTRGFTWAWFIHFCMVVVVFSFIALGTVTPGG
jgi:Type II CAAX prenyl endopeptidase Rce1-like